MNSLVLFIAQGLFIGRVPFAPGTFGSVLGLGVFAALISGRNFWFYVTVTTMAVPFAVWFCSAAERILQQTDPGSIVLDEIVAIPICFLPVVTSEWLVRDGLPPLEWFFSGTQLWITLGIVAGFRLFDIWKPWPVRQLQNMPGGWGVVMDDVVAAVYVALLSILVLMVR
jgi:phosphatidylglycerophosphatase A